jgi:competence protein ComEC
MSFLRRLTNLGLGIGFLATASLSAQSGTLQIVWTDVEGGAATLIVTPSGQSLLVDTGFPQDDRDAKRIFAAAQAVSLVCDLSG